MTALGFLCGMLGALVIMVPVFLQISAKTTAKPTTKPHAINSATRISHSIFGIKR